MIENVSTQLTVFHCFAHCLLPGRAFASLYALLFLEKEAEIGGRGFSTNNNVRFGLIGKIFKFGPFFNNRPTVYVHNGQAFGDMFLLSLILIYDWYLW